MDENMLVICFLLGFIAMTLYERSRNQDKPKK
jgi:hypothetical protein